MRLATLLFTSGLIARYASPAKPLGNGDLEWSYLVRGIDPQEELSEKATGKRIGSQCKATNAATMRAP
jgi:hypothetical protein